MTVFQTLPQKYPQLMPFYPFKIEHDFTVTWQCDFCARTLPHVMLLCVFYFSFCFLGKYFMQSKKAFDLKKSLVAWNFFLCCFSVIGTIRTMPFLIDSLIDKGLYYSTCTSAFFRYGQGPEGFWTFLFIMSKIPELIDTVFIVLRKKPLIFLHWYHHITVLLFCWHSYATKSSTGIFFCAMNYSVHAVMYFYYFLTALGYRPQWAFFVTIMQLSQMFLGMFVCLASFYYVQKKRSCLVDSENLKWGLIMYSSYFILFLKFFLERYWNQNQLKKKST